MTREEAAKAEAEDQAQYIAQQKALANLAGPEALAAYTATNKAGTHNGRLDPDQRDMQAQQAMSNRVAETVKAGGSLAEAVPAVRREITGDTEPKPGGTTNGDKLAELYNARRASTAIPPAPRRPDMDYSPFAADATKRLADHRGTAVDRSIGIADNTDKIHEAFENMKALAHTDPDAYKKEFMKDNYKGHHAASDILSGVRQILTGGGGGKTNADMVNALLSEKMNALRDKNRDTQTQLGLKQQESILGESSRVAREKAAAELDRALEEAGYSRDYNTAMAQALLRNDEQTMALLQKTAEDKRNNDYDAKVMDYNAALTRNLVRFNADTALESELTRMRTMNAEKRSQADEIDAIYRSEGREPALRRMAALQGQPFIPSPGTSLGMGFMDILDGILGRR